MKRHINFDVVTASILLLLTAIVIILQILFSGPNSTRLETSLFSIIQFILALAFSWILARISLKEEFRKSQKSFAIAAYRRITEIDAAIERLIDRTSSHIRIGHPETKKELDVILEISLGVRESIKSSISDWADIIGEEIVTINKIKELQEEKFMQPLRSTDYNTKDKIIELNNKIEEMLSSLPTPLRLSTEAESLSYTEKQEIVKSLLDQEIVDKGFISLEGYCDDDFDSNIGTCNVGDRLKVRIGDGKRRKSVLIAYDQDNKSKGVILNKFSAFGPYPETMMLFLDSFEQSEFDIELISIQRRPDEACEVYYNFSAKLLDCGPTRCVVYL
jgi:hypothetical protein